MPRILFPQQTATLASSKGSISGGRRSSSSWSQYNGKSSGSSNLYEMGLKRSLVERNSINSSKNYKGQYWSSSSISPLEPLGTSNSREDSENTVSHEDWGFFVDITPQEERQQEERRFLNGYDSDPTGVGGGLAGSQRSVLKPIPDSGL